MNLLSASPTAGIEGQRAALAAELAAKLLPVPEILKRYDLSAAELRVLLKDSQFRSQVAEFKREWNAPMSARERVRVKSALVVEDGLLELARIFHDADTPVPARLDAYRELVKLADMQPKKEAEGPVGPGFSISISIPMPDQSEPKRVTLEGTAQAVDDDED